MSSGIVSFRRRNATGVRLSVPNIFLRRINPPFIKKLIFKGNALRRGNEIIANIGISYS